MSPIVAWFTLYLGVGSSALAREPKDIGRGSSASGETEGGRRVAVIIGVDDYGDPQIADLQYTDDDARGVAATLIQSGRFRKEDVLQMVPSSQDAALRPTRANILAQLARLQDREDMDMLVVYFSGHGSAEQVGERRENYIFPLDTQLNVLESTGIRVADIVAQTSTIPAKTRIIIFDACRTNPDAKSTALSTGFQDERYDLAEGTGIVYGARFNAPAYEEPDLQHGAFTAYLLEGLSGRADGWANVGPGDGVISLREAYQYAADQLLLLPHEKGPQMPFLDGELYGDPGLVWVPLGSRPEPCPTGVDDLALLQSMALRECSDSERFTQEAQAARRALACLHAPLTPALAIRAHQIDALYSLELLDRDAAAKAWRAATLVSQAAELRLSIPLACVPDLALRSAADGLAVSTRPAPEPPDQGDLLIDGRRGGALFEGVPTYVQVRWDKETADAPDRLELSGDVVVSPTPLYADHVEPYDSKRKRTRSSNHLLLFAGGTTLASGGLLAGAMLLEADWRANQADASKRSESQTQAEQRRRADALESERRWTNGLWIGGQAAATVAVGVGATALVVRF